MSSQQFSLTRSERKAVLRSANASHIKIEIVQGIALAPREVGSRYWKTTFVRHYPSGKTFHKTLYTPSTRRVIVGSDWVRPQA